MANAIQFTRQQLYDAIWAEPMIHFAARNSISDTGLRKICKKHDIPWPPAGYWAKKAAGKSVRQIPLSVNHRALDQIVFKGTGPAQETAKAEMPVEYTRESDPLWRISVSNRLRLKNPLVKATRDALRQAAAQKKRSRQGPYGHGDSVYNFKLYNSGPGHLAVAVNAPLIPRAMRIIEALVEALERRAFPVIVRGDKTEVTVMGEPFKLALYEQMGIKTVSGHYGPRREMAPSGLLRLTAGYWNKIEEKHGRVPLEERLNEFIAGLVKNAIETKAKRNADEAKHREWLEQEAVRQKAEQERKTHKLRIEHVKRLAADWKEQDWFRAFLEAAERRVNTIPEESQADASRRLEWVREHVAQRDAVLQLLVDEWPVAVLKQLDDDR
jgi:hypothetical protein